ncbi:MAG: DMT family transporter [Phycisphaerales bacterium]|nr:DMT family transporter [Phycisphaerales bacterium]
MKQSQNTRGIICVTITLLGWSSVLLFLRHLHTEIDGWTANGWRYGMCALVLLPMVLAKQAQGQVQASIWWRAIVPAVFNCFGQVCFGFSVYYIEPGLAGFLLRVALISSTLGAFVLFADERPLLRSPIFWGGMFLVAAGSVGTVALGIHPIQGATARGVLLGAAAGAFFGLYGVSVRYWMRGVPSVLSFAAISNYTALVMVGLMLCYSETQGGAVFDLSPMNLTFLVLSAFLGIAIGHIAYYASIARLGVAVASAVVQLAPFIGGAASVFVFGEILTLGQWGSGLIMLVGSALLLCAERRRPRDADVVQPAFPVELEDAGDPCALAAEASSPVDDTAGGKASEHQAPDLEGCR